MLLAGGLARRMGGGDKPMRQIGGRTILARVIARLAPQCDGLILNANGDPARFASFGLPVIPDPARIFRDRSPGFSPHSTGPRPTGRTSDYSERRGGLSVPAARLVARLHRARVAEEARNSRSRRPTAIASGDRIMECRAA